MTTPDYLVKRDCHDCGAKPGEFHGMGCDMEQCPLCGGQLISCPCATSSWGQETSIRWAGITQGTEECIEFGWFSKEIVNADGKHVRWERCGPDDPEAGPDLNRLGFGRAVWSREKRRWVLP